MTNWDYNFFFLQNLNIIKKKNIILFLFIFTILH